MQFYQSRCLAIFTLSILLSACSSGNSSNPAVTSSTEAIEFTPLEETLEFPIGSAVDGVQQATGVGSDQDLLYVLTNNQRVVVFTEEAELVEQFEISMLGTVSAQALSIEEGDLAVIDSQGQLYLRRAGEQAIDVISFDYPQTPDFAALTYGENGDWLTVNRTNEKTLYTLETDGDLSSMALDTRLNDYNIVGADVDNGRLFVMANRFGQERSSSIFELNSEGQVIAAWSFTIEDDLVPDGLNVADPDTAEFVIVYSDPLATVKLFELP